jgi:hypothetical protein
MFCLLRTAHSVPAEATYKDITEVLEGLYGDHHLAAAYCSQLIGEFLQEFAATIGQMAHRAFVGLPLHFIEGEVAYALDWIRDQEVKIPLFMGGEIMLNKALSQALRLQRWQLGHQQGCGW